MQELLAGILYAFAALFIILDPLLSVPIFAAMTKGQAPIERLPLPEDSCISSFSSIQ
jgi:small neutral amino acid transporter SnatA (MarC family)